MKIKFWGVRGSIPTPPSSQQIKDKIRSIIKNLTPEVLTSSENIDTFINNFSVIEAGLIGGNTSCIEVRTNNHIIIFDMGSGIKRLGAYIMAHDQKKEGIPIHIFLSHTHWDHIMGFPFFAPAYVPQNEIYIYSPHPNFQKRLELQQDFRFFPVSIDDMPSEKKFIPFKRNSEVEIGSTRIKNIQLYHPGASFGYRVEHDGKVFVYATDSEYKVLSSDAIQHYIDFFRDADLLVFDAQYTFDEAMHKEDWGHSSAIVGIDFSVDANVKKLALFHHEPDKDDFAINTMLEKSLEYKKIEYPHSDLKVFLATEEFEINL